jgi:hypothetical protein
MDDDDRRFLLRLRLPVAVAQDLNAFSNAKKTFLRGGQIILAGKEIPSQGHEVAIAQESPRNEGIK